MKFEQIPNPYLVSVHEVYLNEAPESVIVNIGSLDEDNGYRRAVLDAIKNPSRTLNVSYETLQTHFDVVRSGDIIDSVTLYQDDNLVFDGYTIPDEMSEDSDWLDETEHEIKNAKHLEMFEYLRHKMISDNMLLANQKDR